MPRAHHINAFLHQRTFLSITTKTMIKIINLYVLSVNCLDSNVYSAFKLKYA